ncbi:hypothetical protein Tco_0265446 [Tanacetum coccineum]
MSTQQNIYVAGSENRPPMLNKDNYVPWSSRLLRYAKSKPNGKLIYNSIMHGPYVRRMIPEPGDPDREVPVAKTFHEQTDEKLTEKEVKQMEADDQAIQTILMGIPKTSMLLLIVVKLLRKSVQNPGARNVGNQNGLIVVLGIANPNVNQHGNGNVVAARAKGNDNGNNGNQIRCYNCRGLGHLTVRPRRKDAAYLQTQLLIAQKEEARIQLQAKEFDLMAPAWDLDEIEEVNTNYILMANLQQASKLGTQTDKSSAYDSDGSAEVHEYDNCYNNEIFNMFTQEEHYTELLDPISEPHQLSKEKSTVSYLQQEKKKLESDLKIREDELLDKQIQLENKIKELDNILVKTVIEQKRDTTYQRQVFTRKRVFIIPNTAYPPSAIRRIRLTMTEQNNYIFVTQKTCISNDNEGRMIERNFVEIQGAFLVKIRDNTFNGAIEENVFEHINKFLEVVGPIKINGVSQDQFRLSIFLISLAGAAGEWFKKDYIGSVTTWDDLVEKFVQKFYQLSDHNEDIEEDDDPDDITDIFKIEGNLFDFQTPLCEAFNDFNYLLKIDKDLFTFDIQGTGTYEEYELNNHVTRDLEEPWLDNRVPYQLCDHICKPYHSKNGVTKWPTCSSDIDGFCNGGELHGMVWAGSMTYFQDHKCFGNFHKLDYNVLVKLQECWWKINTYEVAPFTRLESYGQRPYANIKTKKAHDPYLEVNNIFGRNYDTSNAQDNQGHEERRDDPALEPSVCKIRRFEMMKYSFNADEEYIAIKESEYLNHSKNNLDAYRELLRIINEGWVMATPDEE